MRPRIAALIAAALLSAAAGCARSDPAADLVLRLQREPGLPPPVVEKGDPVVLVEVAVAGTTVVVPQGPIPQPGARLNLERALAKRRSTPPVLWAVVTSPDGSDVRYWAATTDQAKVRVTIPDRDGDDRREHRGGRRKADGALTSIRVPFVPEGQVRLYRSSGALLDTIPFGPVVEGESPAECPEVHVVRGGETRRETLDILVLSDGFTENELDLYRCGTSALFERLLAMTPFDRVAQDVNVFRMDLVSEKEGVRISDKCPADRAQGFTPFSGSEADAAALRASCPDTAKSAGFPLDLGFFHDPDVSPDCRVLWAHGKGLRKVWSLTRCAPDVDMVVVIANSTAQAGSGTGDGHPPISVVTLEDAKAGGTRATLLAHELGHALGLLDEYAGSTGELPEFQSGRNVARRLPDGTIETPPWAEACTGGDGVGYAPCAVVIGTTCVPDPPVSQTLPAVGLIEGAFYSRCGYFRASDTCVLDQETDYCAGCRIYLDALFDELGMRSASNSGSPR